MKNKLTAVCSAIIGVTLILLAIRAPVDAKSHTADQSVVANTVVHSDYAGFLVHSTSDRHGSAQLSVDSRVGEPALMFYDAGESSPSVAVTAGGLQIVTGDGHIHFIDLNELAALDTSSKPGVAYSRTLYRKRVVETQSRK